MGERNIDTHLGQTLRLESEEIRTRHDALAKRFLGNREILARILKGAVAEFREMEVPDIMQCIGDDPAIGTKQVLPGATNEKNAENTVVNEGTIFFDVVVDAFVPKKNETVKIIINIEAQNIFHPGYPIEPRGIFYASRLISSQYHREFGTNEYDKLKKVYSIWVCFRAGEDAVNAITEYRLEPNHLYGQYGSREKCDYLSVIVIGVDAKAVGCEDNPLLDVLTVLFTDKMQGKEKLEQLERRHGLAAATVKEGVFDMCNYSDGVYNRGMIKGVSKTICDGLFAGHITLETALKLSNATEKEVKAWMRELHPEYKFN